MLEFDAHRFARVVMFREERAKCSDIVKRDHRKEEEKWLDEKSSIELKFGSLVRLITRFTIQLWILLAQNSDARWNKGKFNLIENFAHETASSAAYREISLLLV